MSILFSHARHMEPEHAFVSAIRDDPGDDTARLIYADWLAEAGSPQAELIRVQIELRTYAPGEPNRVDLMRREQELLENFGEELVKPLRNLGAIGVSTRSFRGGLIERATFPADRFLAQAAEICRLNPALSHVELRGAAAEVDALAELNLPQQIHHLSLSKNQLTPQHIGRLTAAQWWNSIRGLDISFNQLGDDGVAMLFAASLPQLQELWLGVNAIGPDGAQVIADSPSSGTLRFLSLRLNTVGRIGAQRLASSGNLQSLRKLDLASNRIESAEALPELANATWFESLEELILRGNAIRDADAVDRFIQSQRWRNLRLLDLRNNGARTGQYGYGAAARNEEDPLVRLKQALESDGVEVLI